MLAFPDPTLTACSHLLFQRKILIVENPKLFETAIGVGLDFKSDEQKVQSSYCYLSSSLTSGYRNPQQFRQNIGQSHQHFIFWSREQKWNTECHGFNSMVRNSQKPLMQRKFQQYHTPIAKVPPAWEVHQHSCHWILFNKFSLSDRLHFLKFSEIIILNFY